MFQAGRQFVGAGREVARRCFSSAAEAPERKVAVLGLQALYSRAGKVTVKFNSMYNKKQKENCNW